MSIQNRFRDVHTHDELFALAVRGMLTTISEFSGDCSADYRALRQWVAEYAAANNLTEPPVEWHIYIFDDEE